MYGETLDEIINRMQKECEKEKINIIIKKDNTDDYQMFEKYTRQTSNNKEDGR